MKKMLLIAVAAFACTMAYAQPRAIGGRLGAFEGVSYQHALGENNMIEIEAGYSIRGNAEYWGYWKCCNVTERNKSWGNSIQAAVTYDWIDPFGAKFPEVGKGGFHWYMGVGAAGGYGLNAYTRHDENDYKWGFVAAAGRVGVEYDFWFPLQLSIDYRPTIGASISNFQTTGMRAGMYWEVTSLAIGVRYMFNR